MISLSFIKLSLLLIFSKTIKAQESKDLFLRNNRPLPIDGSWSEWHSWSTCYINRREHKNFYPPLENYLLSSRNRSCNSPSPINGGKDCSPPAYRFRQCLCMNPIGLSTKLIPDSQITGSSYLPNYPPYQARLNTNSTGWCSKYRISYVRKAFIQINFAKFAKIGALKTLGTDRGRTVSYKVEYSLNGKIWNKIQSDTGSYTFKGNILRKKEKQSNFNSHQVVKHLRVFPTKSYNSPCLKMEVLGCEFSCGSTLTNAFGKVTARSNINIDQNCLWRIEILNTTSLTFNFNIFDIKCEHGYLDFHDGSDDFSQSTLLKRFCLENQNQALPTFKINSNVVWLNFVSNSSDSEDGFNIRYFSECEQRLQLLVGEPVAIKSPNYPNNYFDNLECIWEILPPIGSNNSAINLTVIDINVESPTASCSDDFITVKYYKDDEETIIGSFCNLNKPNTQYQMNADKILIEFKTDLIYSKKGFYFTAVSGSKVKPTTKGSSTTLHTNLSTEERTTNRSGSVPIEKKKDDTKDEGADWTIIIISAFSAFVLILLVTVIGMNIRRYLTNRNELNAQCAKVAAKTKEKKIKKNQNILSEHKALLQHNPPVQIIMRQNVSPVDNQNNIQTHDSIDEDHTELMSQKNEKIFLEPHEHFDRDSPSAELDTPSHYENSIDIHSPLKSPSTPNASTGDINNESDVESCV